MSILFNIITYNTHLYDETIAGTLSPSLIHEDSTRESEMVKKFNEDSLDLVCLNEVWDDSIKTQFATQLKTQYPYSFNFNNPIVPSAPDNGLLILSKCQLSDTNFTEYDHLKGWDALGRKGFMRAKVLFQYEQNEYIPIYVFVTHTQADDSEECQKNLKQLRDAVESIAWGYYPVIVLGDLNTTAEDSCHNPTEEYLAMLDLFKPYGFCDLYRNKMPNAAEYPGYTSDGINNELCKIFNPSNKSQTRIDYILVNSKVNLASSLIEIPENYTYYGTDSQGIMKEIDLSDHYPLKATLDLKPI